MLKELITLSDSLDRLGKIQASNEVDLLIKESAKKKTKKRTPTNKNLWSRAKAEAKKRFKVYPCVPVKDSYALTKAGWTKYDDLKVGDEIVVYNTIDGNLLFDEIKQLHFYKNAELVRIKDLEGGFDFLSTRDHKWVVNGEYPQLIKLKDLESGMDIITSSELDECEFKTNVVNNFMTAVGVKTISELQLLAEDGLILKFKNKKIFENIVLGSAILGFRIVKQGDIAVIFKQNVEPFDLLEVFNAGSSDVWCPETSHGTWLMRQGDLVTITGNSAYANGWAVRWYKEHGGGWRGPKPLK